MDLRDLPLELFLSIVYYLSPRDVVRCRRVCHGWDDVFTSDAASHALLRWNFPHCRETRQAEAEWLLTAGGQDHRLLLPYQRAELEAFVGRPKNWAAIFSTVARRYSHLRDGRPLSVDQLKTCATDPRRKLLHWRSIPTWDRSLAFKGMAHASFHHKDPMWWYSREDGLLVYPAQVLQGPPGGLDKSSTGYVFELFDPETGGHTVVPFDVRQKFLRRVRLSHGVLVFEWADPGVHYLPNTTLEVYRHFATAFDVLKTASPVGSAGPKWTCSVKLRCGWELNLLSITQNGRDRFFSTHNATHYAGYVYRERHASMGGDAAPFEQLDVWDMSARVAAAGRPPPSDDPWQPPPEPILVRRVTSGELGHYGVRQHENYQLRNLALDMHNVYFIEEEHRWAQGKHITEPLPRVHVVRSTGIPIMPFEPPPPGPGDRTPSLGRHRSGSCVSSQRVLGPRWLDTCGADGDVHLSFCRHITPSDAPPARWPGHAPCWRHDEFPYLTVSEVVDPDAGVHISARRCVMLECLSANVRPGLWVGCPLPGSDDDDDDDDDDDGSGSGSRSASRVWSEAGLPRNAEARLPDQLYSKLLGRGTIAGDERWIIGESGSGLITIVRF